VRLPGAASKGCQDVCIIDPQEKVRRERQRTPSHKGLKVRVLKAMGDVLDKQIVCMADRHDKDSVLNVVTVRYIGSFKNAAAFVLSGGVVIPQQLPALIYASRKIKAVERLYFMMVISAITHACRDHAKDRAFGRI
jgi:hypothetical protein